MLRSARPSADGLPIFSACGTPRATWVRRVRSSNLQKSADQVNRDGDSFRRGISKVTSVSSRRDGLLPRGWLLQGIAFQMRNAEERRWLGICSGDVMPNS